MEGLVWGPLILGDQLGVSLGHPALGSAVLRPLLKKKKRRKKKKRPLSNPINAHFIIPFLKKHF